MYSLDWGPTVRNHQIWSAQSAHSFGAYSWWPTVSHHQIWSCSGARKVLIRLGPTVGGLRCRTTGFGAGAALTRLGASSWGSTVPHHQLWSARGIHSTGGLQCRATRFGARDVLTRLGAYTYGGLQLVAYGAAPPDLERVALTLLGAYSWGPTVPHHQIWSARYTHSVGGLQLGV